MSEQAEEPKSYPLPDGFEGEDAFCQWIREEFQLDLDADRLNRDAQLEDIEFFAGQQWKREDLDARKGRPCLTINTLPSFVAQVTGDIRINRPSIKIRPAEDNDKDEADVREGLIRQIERQSDAQGVYVDAGQAQCVGGQGAFEITIDYASEEVFDRVLGIRAIPNPLAVVWDRMGVEKTGKDASKVWVNDKMTRKAFDKDYPDKVPSDLTSDMATSDWVTTDTVRITRLCLMQEKDVEIALLQDGTVIDVNELGGRVPLRTRKTKRRSCWIYLTNGHSILAEPVEWPINRVPVIKVTGWEVWVGDRRDRWGLVRFAKDPQKLKNYWRSISAETLALAPKAQWLAPQQGDNLNDEFRDSATDGDTVLMYDARLEKPTRVDPPQVPAAVLNEASMNAQDMKDVTGLHDASLGARSNETSGKAILARQREGDVATYVYQDNLKASIQAGGDVLNQLVPVTYDTARTLTILGVDEVPKSVRINDPNAGDSINFGNSRYDVVVDTGPSYSTKRVEAADALTSLAQSMPILGQVAPDLIVKSFDVPMADEVAERIRRSLPPALVADKDAPPQQPPPPPPEQQQAMAMQMRKAELDLAEQQARVRKAEADADKAESEAAKAMAEASMIGVNPHQHAPLSAPIEPYAGPYPMEDPAYAAGPSGQNQFVQPPEASQAAPMAPNFEQGPVSPEPLAPDQGLPAA